MKQIAEVEIEINQVIFELTAIYETRNEGANKTRIAFLERNLEFLKTIKMYLKFEPRQAFLESELVRLTTKRDAILAACERFQTKEAAAKFKSANDLTIVNNQIKTIKYILQC